MKILESINESFLVGGLNGRSTFNELTTGDMDRFLGDLMYDISPSGQGLENLPFSELFKVLPDFVNACAMTCYDPVAKLDFNSKIPTRIDIENKLNQEHGSILNGLLFFIDRFLSFDEKIGMSSSDFRRDIFNQRKQAYLRVKEALAPSGETED